jgi:hypothetical protein
MKYMPAATVQPESQKLSSLLFWAPVLLFVLEIGKQASPA